MTLCENHGAWFIRKDGARIERGDVFDATEDEMARMAYKIKAIHTPVYLGRPFVEAVGASTRVATVPPPPMPGQHPDWPLRMTPAMYLQIEPQGPYAKLAQRLSEESKVVESPKETE